MNVADLLQERTNPDHGHSIGYDDWLLAVEIMLPNDGASLWGAARWDEQNWATEQWHDITEFVRGISWTRGADEYQGRPRVGYGTLTLTNVAGEQFSPINPIDSFGGVVTTNTIGQVINFYFGPGTILRVVAHSPTHVPDPNTFGYLPGESPDSWVQQITGVVESWTAVDQGAERPESYVNVTFVETLSKLAAVDENAGPTVGDNEIVVDRLQRLADAAGWPYGYTFDLPIGYDQELGTQLPLQSTDMADNRLSECYLTADSVGGTVRSDRSGALYGYGGYFRTSIGPGVWLVTVNRSIVDRGPVHYPSLLACPDDGLPGRVFIDPSEIVWENDDSVVVNSVTIGRAGGTGQTAEDSVSTGRYGKRTFRRQDLINKSDAVCLALAEDMVDRSGRATLRLRSVRLDNLLDERGGGVLATLDVGSNCYFAQVTSPGGGVGVGARVDGMTHNVTPTSPTGPLRWTCDYRLGWQQPPVHFEGP